ncbi:uncharacterized protein METZ01_LOCUS238586, partial [marine metagenome]
MANLLQTCIGTMACSPIVCATNQICSDGNLTVKGNVIYHCGGSPEFRWGTASTHVNWRMAVQETISNAWEIGSGLVDADVSNDTFTRHLWVGTNYICGSCCFKAPAIYGASWVCSDAKVSGTCTCGRVCLESPIVCATSRVNFGVCATSYITSSANYMRLQTQHGYGDIGSNNSSWFHFYTDLPGWYFGSKCVYAEICFYAPRMCGVTCIGSPIVCAQGGAGLVCAAGAVCAPIVCATTHFTGPLVCANVAAPATALNRFCTAHSQAGNIQIHY